MDLKEHNDAIVHHFYPGSLHMGFNWMMDGNCNNYSLYPSKIAKKLNQGINFI